MRWVLHTAANAGAAMWRRCRGGHFSFTFRHLDFRGWVAILNDDQMVFDEKRAPAKKRRGKNAAGWIGRWICFTTFIPGDGER
jgi:hypothetical protein